MIGEEKTATEHEQSNSRQDERVPADVGTGANAWAHPEKSAAAAATETMTRIV